MTVLPRFTITTILGCTAAIALCLGVAMASEASQVVQGIAMAFLPLVVCICIGYLANRRVGAYWGLLAGAMILATFWFVVVFCFAPG
jgi:hypothetical protein